MIKETTVSTGTGHGRRPRSRSSELLLRGRGARRSVAPVLRGRPRLAGRGHARRVRRRAVCRGGRRLRRAGAARGVLRVSGSAPAGRHRAGARGTQRRRLRPAGAAPVHRAADRRVSPRRAAWDPMQEDAGQRRRPAAAGPAGRQRPQAVFRDAGRHAGRPVAVGARAARPEAAAAHRRRVHLRGRAGRDVRGRDHRHDLQPQPAGGGHPGRVRVPLTPRRAAAARVPAAAPRRRRGEHRARRAGDGAGARHQALSPGAGRLPADRPRGRSAGGQRRSGAAAARSSTTSRS